MPSPYSVRTKILIADRDKPSRLLVIFLLFLQKALPQLGKCLLRISKFFWVVSIRNTPADISLFFIIGTFFSGFWYYDGFTSTEGSQRRVKRLCSIYLYVDENMLGGIPSIRSGVS